MLRAETHRVFDVTGAGDTVVATLAAALAVGAPLADAVRLANVAAGIKVSKPGTATVTPQELRQAFGAAMGDGVVDARMAAAQVATWRRLGLKVGFTNGVFDLLHRGHLHSLEQAKRRVDRLVVGVNSDASVRRLKGPERPVQDEGARAAVLAALRFVDLVIVFGEDTPEELIRAVKPDLLFKGADYAGQEIPGAAFVKANGGSVTLLPLLEGYSTTSTVKKVRKELVVNDDVESPAQVSRYCIRSTELPELVHGGCAGEFVPDRAANYILFDLWNDRTQLSIVAEVGQQAGEPKAGPKVRQGRAWLHRSFDSANCCELEWRHGALNASRPLACRPLHAAVKIRDVFVEHADAAVGHEAADRIRRVGAVDGVLAAGNGHRRDAHGV